MSAAQIVWVVVYHHRHGRDVWVCATEAKARQTVLDTMGEWLADIDDDGGIRREIASCIKARDFASAKLNWKNATDEYFDIDSCEVQS